VGNGATPRAWYDVFPHAEGVQRPKEFCNLEEQERTDGLPPLMLVLRSGNAHAARCRCRNAVAERKRRSRTVDGPPRKRPLPPRDKRCRSWHELAAKVNGSLTAQAVQ
jgi:hypothetical protein